MISVEGEWAAADCDPTPLVLLLLFLFLLPPKLWLISHAHAHAHAYDEFSDCLAPWSAVRCSAVWYRLVHVIVLLFYLASTIVLYLQLLYGSKGS